MHIPFMLHRIFSTILPVSILLCTVSASEPGCGEPCPKIKLPWGTWKAHSYNKDLDFYTFQNIRFGQAPVRFAESLRPKDITNPDEIQDNNKGHSCIGVDTNKFDSNDDDDREGTGPGATFGLGSGTPYSKPSHKQDEDCLFLDIYVPKTAIGTGRADIPVVVWFYGGAYVFGSKNMHPFEKILYGGAGVLETAKQLHKEVIFVVGNYRLGAFGWLAGQYMESNGVPNAGLTDQQLLLQWVHDYIGLVGGDKNQVSAWGESAGGGSIIHHLVANGGSKNPRFQKAIIQSAAYFWAWDRTGALNETYQEFAKKSGCLGHDITCLRGAPVESLMKANEEIVLQRIREGKSPFGPSVDGNLIRDLPAVEFHKGNYWPHIDSLILSHVVHEADRFVPQHIPDFYKFIDSIFPPAKSSVAYHIQNFPLYISSWRHIYLTPRARVIAVAKDAFFTSNVMQVYNAYKATGKVYVTLYGWPNDRYSKHASDVLPIFFYDGAPLAEALKAAHWNSVIVGILVRLIKHFSPRYKQYFVSHAITGNPNDLSIHKNPADHYNWKPARVTSEGTLDQVAKSVGMGKWFCPGDEPCSEEMETDFSLPGFDVQKRFCVGDVPCFQDITDTELSNERGDFWTKMALELSRSSSASAEASNQRPLLADQDPKDEL